MIVLIADLRENRRREIAQAFQDAGCTVHLRIDVGVTVVWPELVENPDEQTYVMAVVHRADSGLCSPNELAAQTVYFYSAGQPPAEDGWLQRGIGVGGITAEEAAELVRWLISKGMGVPPALLGGPDPLLDLFTGLAMLAEVNYSASWCDALGVSPKSLPAIIQDRRRNLPQTETLIGLLREGRAVPASTTDDAFDELRKFIDQRTDAAPARSAGERARANGAA